MRPLEVILLAATAGLLLAGRVRPWTRPAAAVPVAVIAGHALAEGARWQLAPAYAVGVGVGLTAAWPAGVRFGRRAAAAGAAGLALAAALGLAYPVFRLPTPGGPHPVGSVTLLLTDPARDEPRAGRPGVWREVLVQLWYPAAHAGPDRVPYRPRAELPFRAWHLALVGTHASPRVPLARGPDRLPVVLYSPSWTGSRSENTVQLEELASRGFLVAAVDHPYGAAAVARPDGRVVRTTMGGFLAGATVAEVEASVREAETELAVRTADIRLVLDELARLDRGDPDGLFTGRIDMSRVGILGYSFGGAVAAEAARTDGRLKAVVNLDGTLFGRAARDGVRQPYLFVTNRLPDAAEPPQLLPPADPADEFRHRLDRDDAEAEWRTLTTYGGALLEVPAANHSSFTVGPLHRSAAIREATAIAPRRMMALLADFVVGFFTRWLEPSAADPLVHAPGRYPEARLRTWPRPDGDRHPVPQTAPAGPQDARP